MPDHSFHKRGAALTLGEIARRAQCQPAKGVNESYIIEDVAPLDAAGAKDLTFLDNIKYKGQFLKTKAGACIIRPEMEAQAPKGLNLLVSMSPYKSYALAAQ